MKKGSQVYCRMCNKPKPDYLSACVNPHCPGKHKVRWGNATKREK